MSTHSLKFFQSSTDSHTTISPFFAKMDPDNEVLFDYPSLFRVYKSGRIVRLPGTTDVVPALIDSATGVASKDVTIDPESGVSARLYLPNTKKQHNNINNKKLLPILIYFHGGSFCVFSAASPQYHSFLNSLVSRANVIAVSVSYRLATEHLLPAAYEDSWAALKWALDSHSDEWLAEHGDFERVFVAGDSAGGNIAHQMAMRAGEKGVRIEGMALVDPFFWGREAVGSETTELKTREFVEKLWRVVNLPGADTDDPGINPIAENAPSLATLGCRKAMVCVAEKDVLVERGKAYCEALKGSGWNGEVELVESKGEGHDFHLDEPECEEALMLMAKLVAFFDCEKVQGKLAESSNITCNWRNYHCGSPSLSSKSEFSIPSEARIHITLGTPPAAECDYGLQSLKKSSRETKHEKIYYDSLHFLNGFELFDQVDEENTVGNIYKARLVEKLGELQHDLEMKKEEIHDELWKMGRKRATSCAIGFLLGFLFCVLLLMLKIM